MEFGIKEFLGIIAKGLVRNYLPSEGHGGKQRGIPDGRMQRQEEYWLVYS